MAQRLHAWMLTQQCWILIRPVFLIWLSCLHEIHVRWAPCLAMVLLPILSKMVFILSLNSDFGSLVHDFNNKSSAMITCPQRYGKMLFSYLNNDTVQQKFRNFASLISTLCRKKQPNTCFWIKRFYRAKRNKYFGDKLLDYKIGELTNKKSKAMTNALTHLQTLSEKLK